VCRHRSGGSECAAGTHSLACTCWASVVRTTVEQTTGGEINVCHFVSRLVTARHTVKLCDKGIEAVV